MKVSGIAFKQTLPLFFVHFPICMVYGMLFAEAGLPKWWAPIYTLFANAGALQFLALSFQTEHMATWLLIITLIPMGMRNTFYGLPFIKRYERAHPLMKGYLALGLVDGTFSILMTGPKFEEKDDLRYCFLATFFAHMYGVLGTCVGVLVVGVFPPIPHLEYCLAFFFAAVVFQLVRGTGNWSAFALSCIALVIAVIAAPNHLFLTGIALCIAGSFLLPTARREAV